jgi:hypothetical protein
MSDLPVETVLSPLRRVIVFRLTHGLTEAYLNSDEVDRLIRLLQHKRSLMVPK